ncbi:antitoxin of toxin-antitoxin stability system [Pseudomonas sp. GOM7]|uniref:antitoxin of toxin-antitoxin stability system n=1 Tax=Pseudomonas sp. GOM7 TaxID=2998079 RepID=UPI00227D10B4|nr:antitoxin of toxin-antitoxin stability system [Pseudomonas sp. GOM7]WAJ39129.1 antitoxin of toxin-antitoxin stability system [Pseudomonas sp. GOM7]
MTKETAFNSKLEPECKTAAQPTHRPHFPVTQGLMREQRQAKQHDEFVQAKVAAARASVEAGHGRHNAEVEAEFAARRARVLDN